MWPNNHLNRLYHDDVTRFLDATLGEISGQDVLDAGCGTGRISRHLASRGARVVGVDFADEAIRIARSISEGDNPRYEVGSIFELSGEAQYDVVVTWASLTVACKNAEELSRVFRGFRRLLRPNGRVLFLEPIHKGFLHRVLNMKVDEFCRVLQEAGFTSPSVKQLHFWPARLLLAYLPWPGFFTRVVFSLGEMVMHHFARGSGGDYKAVLASVSTATKDQPNPNQ
jgi:2-polyprenyl-3-methyl-5-hydroxy-6-metoxy-1,4-benzoquinol methylase